jgi:hypothetical protein
VEVTNEQRSVSFVGDSEDQVAKLVDGTTMSIFHKHHECASLQIDSMGVIDSINNTQISRMIDQDYH